MASAELLLPDDNVDLQPTADGTVWQCVTQSDPVSRAFLSRAFVGSMRNCKRFVSSTSVRPQVKSCLGRNEILGGGGGERRSRGSNEERKSDGPHAGTSDRFAWLGPSELRW